MFQFLESDMISETECCEQKLNEIIVLQRCQ